MKITHVFAGVPVTDSRSARAWYERLFDRPPDRLPTEDEAVWQLLGSLSIYVVADRVRAGKGLLTLAVADMDAHLAALDELGLVSERHESTPGSPRKAVVADPDGNAITFFEDPGSVSWQRPRG